MRELLPPQIFPFCCIKQRQKRTPFLQSKMVGGADKVFFKRGGRAAKAGQVLSPAPAASCLPQESGGDSKDPNLITRWWGSDLSLYAAPNIKICPLSNDRGQIFFIRTPPFPKRYGYYLAGRGWRPRQPVCANFIVLRRGYYSPVTRSGATLPRKGGTPMLLCFIGRRMLLLPRGTTPFSPPMRLRSNTVGAIHESPARHNAFPTNIAATALPFCAKRF